MLRLSCLSTLKTSCSSCCSSSSSSRSLITRYTSALRFSSDDPRAKLSKLHNILNQLADEKKSNTDVDAQSKTTEPHPYSKSTPSSSSSSPSSASAPSSASSSSASASQSVPFPPLTPLSPSSSLNDPKQTKSSTLGGTTSTKKPYEPSMSSSTVTSTRSKDIDEHRRHQQMNYARQTARPDARARSFESTTSTTGKEGRPTSTEMSESFSDRDKLKSKMEMTRDVYTSKTQRPSRSSSSSFDEIHKEERTTQPLDISRERKIPKLSSQTAEGEKKEREQAAILKELETPKPTEIFPENIATEYFSGDEVGRWIYERIRECNGERLPYIKEIQEYFQNEKKISFSLKELKEKRREVVDKLMQALPMYSYDDGSSELDRNEYISTHKDRFNQPNNTNYFARVGQHYSNFDPLETRATADPFDSFSNPKYTFDGIEQFDPNFHRNGVDITGVHPASIYGYNNKVADTLHDAGHVIQEVESEHGRFRTLLINNNNYEGSTLQNTEQKQMSLGLLEEIRRKITAIDQDYTTISMALAPRDCKEYIDEPNYMSLYQAHTSGIKDIVPIFAGRLLTLIDDLVHLKKPLFIASTGILHGLQTSLIIHGSARLCDAGTRFCFDHLQSGMIPFGGIFYRIFCMSNPYVGIWHALTGLPMNMYDAMEQGLVDWIIPPNPVLMFAHMSRDIDQTFTSVFKEQDKYRHRTMLKHILELYDRGMEHYHGPCSEKFRSTELKQLFENDRGGFVTLNQFMENLEKGCKGDLLCQKKSSYEELKQSIYRLRKAKEAIERASPLALIFTYATFQDLMKKRLQPNPKETFEQLFQDLLQKEYHMLCWLIRFEDFWIGIKHKYLEKNNNTKPNWSFPTLDAVRNSKDNLLINFQQDSTDSLILKELPWHSCPKWQQTLRHPSESILFPIRSILNNLTESNGQSSDVSWYDSITGQGWYRNYTENFLHDYTMLRGAVPPDIEQKLFSRYSNQWRLAQIYQGRLQTASIHTVDLLRRAGLNTL